MQNIEEAEASFASDLKPSHAGSVGRGKYPNCRSASGNQTTLDLLSVITDLQGAAMTFGYAQPFRFQMGSRPAPTVSNVRHGVTEITLSDGRLVRATLHVKAVKADPKKPGNVDVTYDVIAEIMTAPETPIREVHETIQ